MTDFFSKHKLRFLILAGICFLFAACNGETPGDAPEKTSPTVVVVSPSLTPTSTPTPFPTATATPTPTDTPTPTPTPTPDTVPPVISGVSDIEMKVNGTVSYTKNVTATDNSGESFSFRGDSPNLWVDRSSVNTSKAGTYKVIYYAKDAAGNVTTAEAKVLVSKVSPDEVWNRADQVLSKILTEGMTEKEKAKAVFDYVHNGIAYQDKKGSDYIESAYYGLEENRGDCNVFAATARVLLTRAGIPNLEIRKYPDNNDPHVWNLVNLGEGWFHFDTTVWHPDTADKDARDEGIFLWSTDRLKSSRSNTIRSQHVFDASLYPEIQ